MDYIIKDEVLADITIKNMPNSIYLVLGDLDVETNDIDFENTDEVTWCEDKQWRTDVKYIREDVVKKLIDAINMKGTKPNEN